MPFVPYDSVSVYYPRGVATGGPEALHQLVDALRGMDVEAWLVPFPGTEDSPRVPGYERYDAPERKRIEDVPGSAVVVPEVPGAAVLPVRADHFCWWLSIDNSPYFSAPRTSQRHEALTRAAEMRLLAGRGKAAARRLAYARKAREITHLSQSMYAWATVFSAFGVTPSMVSDYTLHPIRPRDDRRSGSAPVVAFNPAKGGHLIREVRSIFTSKVEWLPLERMSSAEVHDALSRSDVYLDLGHQPGKDRLPREAAAAGAVTIVLRTGAGAFTADVGIPADHKISTFGVQAANAAAVLANVLADIPLHYARQEAYRASVAQERDHFLCEVRGVFVEGLRGLDGPPTSDTQVHS